jgi:hypothetical protein
MVLRLSLEYLRLDGLSKAPSSVIGISLFQLCKLETLFRNGVIPAEISNYNLCRRRLVTCLSSHIRCTLLDQRMVLS